jgi:hypothetical protein
VEKPHFYVAKFYVLIHSDRHKLCRICYTGVKTEDAPFFTNGGGALKVIGFTLIFLWISGLWIRIHFLRIRIRIQWIRMEANTDPDTDPDPIRIQGFNDQKLKKKNS